MNKQQFTKEHIDMLLRTGNVAKCSAKVITYRKDFKIRAVKLYEEGWSPRDIFKQAGFDLDVIGRNKPDDCLRDWRIIYEAKGEQGLMEENRGGARGGGRPKTKGLTDADRIKRLEAQVAYLKAENGFLAKLRANRAE
jgi:transposase